MESDFANDSRYARLQPNTRSPHLEVQEYHLEDMDYAEDSDHELTPTALKEPEKVAIIHSLGRALLQVVLYLVPVGLTSGILQLSFREIYWRGVGSSGSGHFSRYSVNQVLNILQIVAKAHEVLIVIVGEPAPFVVSAMLGRLSNHLKACFLTPGFSHFHEHPGARLLTSDFINSHCPI